MAVIRKITDVIEINDDGSIQFTGAMGATGAITGTLATAAQGNITSLGTLTALTVDNLTIDLNTITANTGALNLVPAGGSAVLIDGAISIDGDQVTGAASITSTVFVGNLTGNASGTAATVTVAAQPAITSLGTLTTVTIDNLTINGNTISAGSGGINIVPFGGSAVLIDGAISIDGDVITGAASITSTAFVGTLSTAAQPNVTSLGTLTNLDVDNININLNTISSGSGNINITPFGGSAIVLDGAINIDGSIVTGATSITSTAFVGDVTGNVSGSAATVTGAAQAAITSLGTLTILNVDNIRIDGNTISSTAGVDLNIVPLAGQQLLLDTLIIIDEGVITGASSITSTTFVGALTGDASGSAATVTGAAQTAITSLGTLTALSVDNIDIDLNTISSSSGNLNLTPFGGSVVLIDGAVSIDGGVVTGVTSLDIIGNITITGTVDGVDVSAIESSDAVIGTALAFALAL